MRKDQFDNLKNHLDEEAYQEIKFSKNEKDRVMTQVKSNQRQNKPAIFRISMSVAAVVTLLLFGTILLNQGLGSNEKAEHQESDPEDANLAADDQNSDKDKHTETEDGVSASGGGNGLNKEWEDVSDFHLNDPENAAAVFSVEEMILEHYDNFHSPVPEQYADDPIHYKVMGIGVIGGMLRDELVEGEAIEKDFKNFLDLTMIVHWENLQRYEHLNLKNENPFKYQDQWKEPSVRMIQAIEYTEHLLHDLNVAVNKEGKGETFGLAYMVDGEQTTELEEFIQAEEFKDMWIED